MTRNSLKPECKQATECKVETKEMFIIQLTSPVLCLSVFQGVCVKVKEGQDKHYFKVYQPQHVNVSL